MKKTLIALAALSAVGIASAQSSVTMFGVVDLNYQYGKSATDSRARMGQDGIASSRFGVRGTEDLGGGMSASFWLEAAIAPDSGLASGTASTNNQPGTVASLFNRRSTMSLAGSFGEIRLGRDYTPTFWNYAVFDPFGANGAGTNRVLAGVGTLNIGGVTQVRASNSFGYFLPRNLGGFYGQAMYYKGENLSSDANGKRGDGYAVRVGFAQGPIDVALATGSLKTAAAADLDTTNLGASYDMGVAKLSFMWDSMKNTAGNKQTGYLLGATVPMGAGQIRASYSLSKREAAVADKTTQWAVGYVHNLSKRTAAYVTFARLSNSGGADAVLNGASAAANRSSTGYDIGLRHTF